MLVTGWEVDVRLDAIKDRLRASAYVISAQVTGVGEEQARWKPNPSQWSILEVVNHLADEEVEDFRVRLASTLSRPLDSWSSIDPRRWVSERMYNDRSLAESLERFIVRRRESISWLEGLDAPDWSVGHDHPRLGRIRAGDLLTSWVAHDYIHIRQLNRLHRHFLVSSISEYAADYAGPW